MFWQSHLIDSTSLTDLLKKETVTLAEVLNDDFTLQEVKNANAQLIAFLTRTEIIEQLMKNALDPVLDPNSPETDRFKFSHQCCEVLTMNCAEISSAVMDCENARHILLNFLHADTTPLPLLASFYTRILTQMISKHTHKMIEYLRESSFIDDCVAHIDTSAIMDLVYRVVIVPCDVEDVDAVKRWYVDSHFAQRLCAIFASTRDCDAHSNTAYLWSELIRGLRDLQYTACEKRVDILLESLQDEKAVEGLCRAMFPASGQAAYSIVDAVSTVLLALVQTNFVPNCPEQLEANADRGMQGGWMGGVSSTNVGGCILLATSEPVWQPDPDRRVETQIAQFASHILAFFNTEEKMECGEGYASAQLALMKLVSALLNTNHPTTHSTIASTAPTLMRRLVSIALDRPGQSLLHSTVTSCVRHVLFTKMDPSSPLLPQLLLPLIESITNCIEKPEIGQSRVVQIQTRGFVMSLAHWLDVAQRRGPNARVITTLIEADGRTEFWASFVESHLQSFVHANEADDVGPSHSSVTLIADSGDAMPDAQAIQAFAEYDSEVTVVALPDHFALPIDSFTSSSTKDDFDIASETLLDLDMSAMLEDLPAGEAAFDALCELRIDALDTGDGQTRRTSSAAVQDRGGGEDVWPSASSATTTVHAFPVAWERNEPGGGSEDWPTTGETDAWADFSSSKASNSWPDSETDTPLPVCAGIASALFATTVSAPRSGMKSDSTSSS